MKKEVKYEVKGKEWEGAQDKAFNKVNANHKVDGFRKGKAPRKMIEAKFPGEILMEAANALIDSKYREIVLDDTLKMVVEPKVEIIKMDDDALEAKFTLILEPEVKLGEYKKLDVK